MRACPPHWSRFYQARRATKIIHQGESRIKVDFPSNQVITALIKYAEDVHWSKTFAAWHIPYTNTAFNQLKSLFPELNKLDIKNYNHWIDWIFKSNILSLYSSCFMFYSNR